LLWNANNKYEKMGFGKSARALGGTKGRGEVPVIPLEDSCAQRFCSHAYKLEKGHRSDSTLKLVLNQHKQKEFLLFALMASRPEKPCNGCSLSRGLFDILFHPLPESRFAFK